MTTKMLKGINPTKPIRMWIDGKVYDIKHVKKRSKKNTANVKEVLSDSQMKSSDSMCNIFEISKNEDGKLYTSLRLPTLYYTKLKTRADFDIEKLSDETNTKIVVPNSVKGGSIEVLGDSEQDIHEVIQKILSVTGKLRDESMPQQFLAIPMLSEEIKQNFEAFKKEILSNNTIQGIEESVFQSSLKLHLTVTVFSLLDDKEKAEAISALQDYKTEVLGPLLEKTGPIKLHASGIDCMDKDYKRTNVLYANVKVIDETEDKHLQHIVNGLSHYFHDRGLLKRYEDNVKLHMTLINTKYRKSLDSPSKRRWPKRIPFDARTIMEKYKDYNFGVSSFETIHLSLISSKGDDGFYKSLVSIDFD